MLPQDQGTNSYVENAKKWSTTSQEVNFWPNTNILNINHVPPIVSDYIKCACGTVNYVPNVERITGKKNYQPTPEEIIKT